MKYTMAREAPTYPCIPATASLPRRHLVLSAPRVSLHEAHTHTRVRATWLRFGTLVTYPAFAVPTVLCLLSRVPRGFFRVDTLRASSPLLWLNNRPLWGDAMIYLISLLGVDI